MRSPEPLSAMGDYFYGEGEKGRKGRGEGLLIRGGREWRRPTSKGGGMEERGGGKGGEGNPPKGQGEWNKH